MVHVDVPPDAAREAMLAQGTPPAYADALLDLYAATRAGITATVTAEVETLLGRPATSFDAYVDRHLDAWR